MVGVKEELVIHLRSFEGPRWFEWDGMVFFLVRQGPYGSGWGWECYCGVSHHTVFDDADTLSDVRREVASWKPTGGTCPCWRCVGNEDTMGHSR